jgi:hypothetical protein
MSKPWLTPLLCVSLLSASACAAAGDGDASDPKQEAKDDSGVKTSGEADGAEPTPPEPAPPKLSVKLAIASVQMIEDCPDPPEPTGSAGGVEESLTPPPMPAQEPPGRQPPAHHRQAPGFAPMQQPCTQSTMQLTASVDGDEPQPVRIAAIRLLDKQGKPVGELSSRKPTNFVDQAYAPWDETAGNAEIKASYKLSVPDWSAVEQATGESSLGYMFKLEVDVEIGGELHTVQSPEFTHELPHVIVT